MQTSNFIASVALIISLFSIWLQDRGIRKQLLLANISAYTKRYQEIFEKFPKDVLDENFKLDSFSKDNQEKILRIMWVYFDLCNEEYTLYHELNLLDKKIWNIWELSMTSAFQRPSFYQCWNVISAHSVYPKSFYKFVNDKMIQLHNSGRRI